MFMFLNPRIIHSVRAVHLPKALKARSGRSEMMPGQVSHEAPLTVVSNAGESHVAGCRDVRYV